MFENPFSPFFSLYQNSYQQQQSDPLDALLSGWKAPADRFSQDQINDEIRKSQSRNFWQALAAGAMQGKGWTGISNSLSQAMLKNEDIRNERSRYYETLNAQAQNDAIQEHERQVRDELAKDTITERADRRKQRADELDTIKAAREMAKEQFNSMLETAKTAGPKWVAEATTQEERDARQKIYDSNMAHMSAMFSLAGKDPRGSLYNNAFTTFDKFLTKINAPELELEKGRSYMINAARDAGFADANGVPDIDAFIKDKAEKNRMAMESAREALRYAKTRGLQEQKDLTDQQIAARIAEGQRSWGAPALAAVSAAASGQVDPENRGILGLAGFEDSDFIKNEMGVVTLSPSGAQKASSIVNNPSDFTFGMGEKYAKALIDKLAAVKGDPASPGTATLDSIGKPDLRAGLRGISGEGAAGTYTEAGTGATPYLSGTVPLNPIGRPQNAPVSREVGSGSPKMPEAPKDMSSGMVAAMARVPPADLARLTAEAKQQGLNREQYIAKLSKFLIDGGYLK